MIGVRQESAWSFHTSGGGGLTIEFLAATGGELVLKDPSRRLVTLRYGGIGVGFGLPFKIPQFGRLNPHRLNAQPFGRSASISGAPTFFPNRGGVLILDSFRKPELTKTDLEGGAVIAEVSLAILAGGSAQAFFLGCNGEALHRAVRGIGHISEATFDRLPPFNALVWVAGAGATLGAGFSSTAYVGYVG